MSQKQVKRYRNTIKKAFSENELKFQRRFLRQCVNYTFRERFRLCKIILFKQIKKIIGG